MMEVVDLMVSYINRYKQSPSMRQSGADQALASSRMAALHHSPTSVTSTSH